MYETVVTNVRLIDREGAFNIGITKGKIDAITKDEIHGKNSWEGYGDLVLPPFVELHTHLDTVLTAGKPVSNQTGTLAEAIEIWTEAKSRLDIEDVSRRAAEALKLLISQGVLFIRAAVDISDPDLRALQAVLKVKETFSSIIDLQIVAFPQEGLESKENQEKMECAVRMGADGVSAVPHLEKTNKAGIDSLDFCFKIARKYEKFIHVFCDEVDDPNSRFLESLAELTISQGMEGKVSASHAIALAYYDDDYAQQVIQLVKQAQLTIVSCPLVNSSMQGRFDAFPKGRGITRVKSLYEEGVNVCIAHDDVQTPFYPLGSGNILQAAHLGMHLAHMTGTSELKAGLEMITAHPAKGFMVEEQYGLEIRKPASFITLPAATLTELISHQPSCRYVFKNGKLVSSTQPKMTTWHVPF
ncbi:amidohydrolase family protein [Halobacillus campisalis]|uniref:Amidohydrolase family protein n=1 Tax=Halobacillus campisalis TaxID=435909 RepID=A0ABW2K716_9BACI|nr:amidohydrolase family protein [Halobacillus campisalis]